MKCFPFLDQEPCTMFDQIHYIPSTTTDICPLDIPPSQKSFI